MVPVVRRDHALTWPEAGKAMTLTSIKVSVLHSDIKLQPPGVWLRYQVTWEASRTQSLPVREVMGEILMLW
jgi:hypothetical protein